MNLRRLAAAALAATLASLALTGCGAAGSTGTTDTTKPLKVMADVIPHAQLLTEVQKQGLLGDVKIQVTQIAGDVDPNQLVQAGDIDANFFQHTPYLKDWNAKHNNADLVSVGGVHIEPLGLYSKKVKLDTVPEKAVIAIHADATNQARALFLIADAGLIKLNVA